MYDGIDGTGQQENPNTHRKREGDREQWKWNKNNGNNCCKSVLNNKFPFKMNDKCNKYKRWHKRRQEKKKDWKRDQG